MTKLDLFFFVIALAAITGTVVASLTIGGDSDNWRRS